MTVEGLDHVAITVSDIDATLCWYERVLGAEMLFADQWEAGRMPVAILQIGQSRLSVHPAAAPAAPHARTPTPGSADLCFRFGGSAQKMSDHLTEAGVDIVEGPVARIASNGERGVSLYFRDPDGNLLELLTLNG